MQGMSKYFRRLIVWIVRRECCSIKWSSYRLLARPRLPRANLNANCPMTMTGDRMLPALEILITLKAGLSCEVHASAQG